MNLFQRIFEAPPSDVVESLICEYLNQIDGGADIDRQAFVADYPLLAVELNERMEVDARVRDAERRRSVRFPLRKPPKTDESELTQSAAKPGRQIAPMQTGDRALDRYEIIAEIGRGAMGRVFKAWDPIDACHVAIKTLHAGIDVPDSQLRRLAREGTAQQGLKHPNIIEIYASGVSDDVPYLVMQCVEGGVTLDTLLEERNEPFAERRAAEIILAVTHAVVYSHVNKVVHRDIKPSNILMDAGVPKLSDFGLAFVKRSNLTRLTQSGEILGTLCYMAPEQLQAGLPDADPQPNPRSDLYSLGVTLYQLLTGRLPFEALTPGVLIQQILEDEPPPPRSLGVKISPAIEAVCMKCLEKSLDKRYYSASALADDVTRYLDGQPVNAPRVNWQIRRFRRAMTRRRMYVAATVLTLVIIGLVAWFGMNLQQSRQLNVLRDKHGALPDDGIDYPVSILLRAASSDDLDTRVAGLIAMTRRPEEELQQALLRAAEDPDRQVRFHLANALVNAPTPIATAVCHKLLRENDGYVAACAVKLAETIGHPELAVDVERFTDTAEPVLRNYAIDAMLSLTGGRNDDFVARQLRTGSTGGRAQLLARLADGAAPAPIPVLIDAISHLESAAERETVVKILRYFTGQEFDVDTSRWEEWWNGKKESWRVRKCFELVWASSKSVFRTRDVVWTAGGQPLNEVTSAMVATIDQFTALRDGKLVTLHGAPDAFKSHRFYIGTLGGVPVGANDFVVRLTKALEIGNE